MANNIEAKEGQSISYFPQFNGNNYSYRKTRMKNFDISIDVEVWRVFREGSQVPKTQWMVLLPLNLSLSVMQLN